MGASCCSASDAAETKREEKPSGRAGAYAAQATTDGGSPSRPPPRGGSFKTARDGSASPSGNENREPMLPPSESRERQDAEEISPTRPPPPPPLDPEEEAARKRRQEVMEEVTAPKIIDFGDLDLGIGEDDEAATAPDAEAVIEAFNNDFEERSPEAAMKNRREVEEEGSPSPTKQQSQGGQQQLPDTTFLEPPSDAWFADHGLPKPNVSWYQTKDKVFISIGAAECDAGWDVEGNKLKLIAYGSEDAAQADMPLFKPTKDVKVDVDAEGLLIALTKADPVPWTQLVTGSRKTFSSITWLKRDISKEDDSDDDDDDDEDDGDDDDEGDDEEEEEDHSRPTRASALDGEHEPAPTPESAVEAN